MSRRPIALRLAAVLASAALLPSLAAPGVLADKPGGSGKDGNGGGGKSSSASGHSDGSPGNSDKGNGQGGGGGGSGTAPGTGAGSGGGSAGGGGAGPGGGSGGGSGSTPGSGTAPKPPASPPRSSASQRSGSSGSGRSGSTSSAPAAPSPLAVAASPAAPASSARLPRRRTASPATPKRSGGPHGAVRRSRAGTGRTGLRGPQFATAQATGAAQAQDPSATSSTSASSNPRTPLLRRAVHEVIEVVPAALKAALAALAAMLVVAAGAAGLSSLRARRLRGQRAELMEEVGVLQSALLPQVPAHIGPLWLSASYRPADGPTAGGHFYDAFELPDGRAGILVGEVSANGRDRLGDAMLARHSLRTHLKSSRSPGQAIRLSREALEGDLTGELRTVTAALYDPSGQRLCHATLGGSSPVIELPGDGPSGSQPATASGEIAEANTFLPAGSRVVLFTSGLEEVRLEGRRLGRDGVAEVFTELGQQATAEDLLDGVAARARSLPSDLAACVLEPDDDPALIRTGDRAVEPARRSAG